MVAFVAFHDPFAATLFFVDLVYGPSMHSVRAEALKQRPKDEAANANKGVPSMLPNPSLRPHALSKALKPRISSVRQPEFAFGKLGHR
jgi:hypothetical protein